MRVLFFTKYTRRGASSRLRTYQYLDLLRAQGVVCTVKPFFSDSYLAQVYKTKTHNKGLALISFIKRLMILCTVFNYDKIVIEKELFPFFPALFERFLAIFRVKYIVDFDDAIWHNYDIHPNPLLKFLLKNKIKSVIRNSGLVVAGNEYILDYAKSAGQNQVVLIPTVVDVKRYACKVNSVHNIFTVGWIGSPITSKYLPRLTPVFQELGKQFNIRLRWVGIEKAIGIPNVLEESIPWSEDTEIELIRSFDVGIMPLEDNIWERGKCGYKLIQYMACGIPVIGTPIGVNNSIINEGVNGLKATTIEDWKEAMTYMLTHEMERKAMGMNGLVMVQNKFSLDVACSSWVKILKGI